MTNYKELSVIAKNVGFIEKIETLGFKLGPKQFWIYRERGNFIDYIGLQLSRSKCYVNVPITCFKKSLIEHCDMSQFPKGFNNGWPTYSSTCLKKYYGVEIGNDPRKVETPKDIEAMFNELLINIVNDGDPWLKNIDSDRKFYESFTVVFKESEEGQKLKDILIGD
ncbi:hypothetical protein [Ferrimonas senticii]|uniref:hypothetical protein n=1 Tax=Ferrimonas senticii TaxID=394566 RepID=UPI0004872765|nr:hypothetical protein [Ferrimonas senticii]